MNWYEKLEVWKETKQREFKAYHELDRTLAMNFPAHVEGPAAAFSHGTEAFLVGFEVIDGGWKGIECEGFGHRGQLGAFYWGEEHLDRC